MSSKEFKCKDYAEKCKKTPSKKAMIIISIIAAIITAFFVFLIIYFIIPYLFPENEERKRQRLRQRIIIWSVFKNWNDYIYYNKTPIFEINELHEIQKNPDLIRKESVKLFNEFVNQFEEKQSDVVATDLP